MNKEYPKAYIKGINGLRSIFIIPIILSHIILNFDEFGLDPFIIGQSPDGKAIVLDMGLYGLGIIFGLSGFLIPYLLGLEKEKRGTVSIKKFYIRRALRIFPIYYAVILFCLIIYHVFDIEYTNWALMILMFYVVNIPYVFGGELPFLGHYWTLAVEEQFYLVWPWIHRFSIRQILWGCWFLLITFLISREILKIVDQELIILKLMDFVWFQCILIGTIFALYYLEYRDKLLKIAEIKWLQISCWILLLIGSFNVLRNHLIFDIELTTAAGCFIVINQNSKKVFVTLENRVFNYIGKTSYSLYIIHNVIIFLCGELIDWNLINNLPLRYVLVISVIFIMSVLASHIIHTLIEKPFLKLKEKKFTYVKGIRN